MKVTLESTTQIVDINGVNARLWQGTTESGIEMHAFIALIGVDKGADTSQFDRELIECAAPRVGLDGVYPARMLLP
jgi:hypothetical protein